MKWNQIEVEDMITAFQSKRAQLKKQVTHWIGKFMVVKAENNRLRQYNRAALARKNELCGMLGEKDKEITQLKEQIKDLQALCSVENV